jgi:hypothetical protein
MKGLLAQALFFWGEVIAAPEDRLYRSSAIFFLLCALTAIVAAQELKLIPEAREIQRNTGQFNVSAGTHIVVGTRHASVDRCRREHRPRRSKGPAGASCTCCRPAVRASRRDLPARTDEPEVARRLNSAKPTLPDDEEGYILDKTGNRQPKLATICS